jgi:putative membrane protein
MGSAADYLAAERTFLAWIRTGLALMGFGFVVARFGLFLQALQLARPNLQSQSFGLSYWFGTALILLGVVVNVASLWNHIRLVRGLQRGESTFARPSSLAITVASILAALGLAMAIYLISVRESAPRHPDRWEKSISGPARFDPPDLTPRQAAAHCHRPSRYRRAGEKLSLVSNVYFKPNCRFLAPSELLTTPVRELGFATRFEEPGDAGIRDPEFEKTSTW